MHWPYYYDDGTEFSPIQLSVPELCLKCPENNIQDKGEKIQCNLTRGDQVSEKGFKCDAFQPIK
jgi:hypothetical protein